MEKPEHIVEPKEWTDPPQRDWVRLDGPGFWYQDKDCKMYWREGKLENFPVFFLEGFPVGPRSTDPAPTAGGTPNAWD